MMNQTSIQSLQTKSFDQSKINRELWKRGLLEKYYHSGQLDIDHVVKRCLKEKKRKASIRTTRRFGKTYYLALFATIEAIRNPGKLIPFGTTTNVALRKIALPVFQEIHSKAPNKYRPILKRSDMVYKFWNGSEIHLFGCDNGHAERIRGIKARTAILDEAGFIDDLEYIIKDILIPSLMYDDGLILCASTPPELSDHYFNDYHLSCEKEGAGIVKTIWQNPMVTIDQILEFAEAVDCKVDYETKTILTKSVTFRREFEAEIIVDPKKKVIVEFDDEKEAKLVKHIERPPFCHKYTILDTGFVDRTAVLFGIWIFELGIGYVESDMNIDFKAEGMNTKRLVEKIRAEEIRLWGEGAKVSRYADCDLILLNDLSTDYGFYVQKVQKDLLQAQVNRARLDICQEKVFFSPKATNTIAQIKYGIWNNRRDGFARTDSFGHFDNLAAFLYFLRHADRDANPYPTGYNLDYYNQYIPEGKNHELLKIFNLG